MQTSELPSTVNNVMTRSVVTIDAGRSARDGAQLMKDRSVGSIVVLDGEKPVGIVTERDVLGQVTAAGLDASKVSMREIMSRQLVTVQETKPIIEAIRLMQQKKIRRLLVLKDKKLLGIVTQTDLLRALALHVMISFRPLLEKE